MANVPHLVLIHHHLICLSDRSTAPSTASSQQSAIFCFFQFFVSSHFLKSIQLTAYLYFLVYSSLLSFLQYLVLEVSSYASVANPVSLPSFYCIRMFFFSLTVCNTFPHEHSDRSSPAFFSNLFQNCELLDCPNNSWRSSGM